MSTEPVETSAIRLGPTTLSVPTGYLIGIPKPDPSLTTDVSLAMDESSTELRFLQLVYDVTVSTVAVGTPGSTELVVNLDDHFLLPVLEDFAAAGDIALNSRTDAYEQTRYFITAVHF